MNNKESFASIEKDALNKEPGERKIIYRNADYVNVETYARLFARLGVRDTVLLDLAAGDLPADEREIFPSYVSALTGRNVRLIPIEKEEERIRTWKDFPGMWYSDKVRHQGIRADVLHLPIKDGVIPGAISLNYVNSFTERAREQTKKFLTEAFRVLRPGGFLIISTFGYVCTLDSQGHMRVNDKIPFDQFVTTEMVMELAKEVGFSSSEKVPVDQRIIELDKQIWLSDDARDGLDSTAIIVEAPVAVVLHK